MKTRKIRLGIIDDHRLFREGLKDLLASHPKLKIEKEGENGFDAMTLASTGEIDVLLIDLRMPKLNGMVAIKRIKEVNPKLKVIVVSMYEDWDHKKEAVQHGADGYFSKMDPSESIIDAILDLSQGKEILPPDLKNYSNTPKENIKSFDRPRMLTELEHRILGHLSLGKSNKEMASDLAMAERTLKNHLTSIFKKLGVKSRTEAIRKGIEKNFISLST